MSNNIPKTAYYALRVDNNHIKSYLRLKSINLTNNCFSFDIWYYLDDAGKSSEIVSQSNGLIMGIEGEKLFFIHPNISGKILIGGNEYKFKSKKWTNIFVSYDNNNFTVAVNGIDIYSREIKNVKLLSKGDVILGAGFSGYMRSFRIYKTCINPVDYKKYLYKEAYSTDMTEIVGFISFTSSEMKDISPNNIAIDSHSASIINCHHVYSAYSENDNGYAKLENSKFINPGFNGSDFSIYAKVYIRPSDRTTQSIFSNGTLDETDSFALCLDCVDVYSSKLKIKIGENTVINDTLLKAYNWIDLLVTYSACKLTLFIDGEKKQEFTIKAYNRSNNGEVILGNAFQIKNGVEGEAFDGYISCAAIFDKLLDADDAKAFFQNHPFIFENNLKALFSFESGIALDRVSSCPLTLANSSLIIAQNTVGALNSEPYEYRVTKTFSEMTEMNKWRVNLIANFIVSYFENAFGLHFTFTSQNTGDYPIYFLYFIFDNFRNTPEFGPLFSGEISDDSTENNNYTSKKRFSADMELRLRRAVASMRNEQVANLNVAARARVGGAPMVQGCITSAAIEEAANLFFIFYAGFAGTEILGKLFEAVKDSRDSRPIYPDDDDDPSRRYKIQILELSMQSNADNIKESAVYCQDGDGKIEAPEWCRSDSANCKYGVYVASEVTSVKIKVKFKLIVLTQFRKDLYEVKLTGYAKSGMQAFFNHLSIEGLYKEGDNYAEFIVNPKNISKHTDDIYKYRTIFNWDYTVEDISDNHIDTIFNLYTLPGIPAPPIYLNNLMPENVVNIDYLAIFAKEEPHTESNDAVDFKSLNLTPAQITAKTNSLYHDGRFKYKPNECPFVKITTVGGKQQFTFYKRKFDLALKHYVGQIEMNCLCYASILEYYIKASGDSNCDILRICNPYGTLPVNPNLIPASWNVPFNGQFVFHAVVVINLHDQSNRRIFDAAFNFTGQLYKNDYTTAQITAADAGSYLYQMFPVGSIVIQDDRALIINTTDVPPDTNDSF